MPRKKVETEPIPDVVEEITEGMAPLEEMPLALPEPELTPEPTDSETTEETPPEEPPLSDVAVPSTNGETELPEIAYGEDEDDDAPPLTNRQAFFGLDFNDLDRDLSAEERQEWNSIYASYRGGSIMEGTIIGVDHHAIMRDGVEHEMYSAVVVPHRIRIIIPASEMWMTEHERPDFVLRNMLGATIQFIITKVDRECDFAIGSRRKASLKRRYHFHNRPRLNAPSSHTTCSLLAVGPRRCLVDCHGYDINLSQRDLRYTAIPDLRTEYRPSDTLECVVKTYAEQELTISVKEIGTHPFVGAEFRHPVGSERQATIAGKYGGGVFCNLPDGTICMCAYSSHYQDKDFHIDDTVIIVLQRYVQEKQQIYGKIIKKW